MSLDQQLLQRTDAIILRSQPRVRRPRSQAVKVILSSGPLTIIQIRTVKGEVAYQFMARSRKYAYSKDFKQLVTQLYWKVYPRDHEKTKAKSRRYYQNHRQERIELARQIRQRRAKQA